MTTATAMATTPLSLDRLRERMESLNDDARFDEWMRIYTSEDPAIQQQFDMIITSHDPVIKLLLAKFLSGIPEETAVTSLVRLIDDSNSVVHTSSCTAFERNNMSGKWVRLMPLLNSTVHEAQLYAVDKLAETCSWDAMEQLLDMLTTTDEALLMHLLKGMRHFPDERILPRLQPFMDDARDEVRFHMALAFGALYEGGIKGSRKLCLLALHDPSPKVRRAVLWSLRRNPNKKDMKAIFATAQSDPEPEVRREALMLFPFFPTEQLAFFLLETLVNENDQSVLLKAEAVLLSFPSAVLTKVMWRVVKSETGKLQHRALVILASLSSGDVKLTHYLLRKLRDEENPKQILPILEALGITENPRAVPMIEPHVKGNPVLAYTAIRSLVKIWVHHHDAVPIATYLEDPEITPLFKQTILKQMLKTGESQLYADTMQPCLVQFLDHENLNIRYLSAQVLAPVPSKDIAEQFFRLLLKEDDMTFTQFLRKSIQSQLTDHPAWMAALVHNHLESKESIRFLFAIIQESKLIGTKLVQLLLSLLAPPVLLHQSLHKDMLQSYLAAVLFQRKMDVAPLMRGMVELPGKDIVVRMLADILRSYPGISFDISVDQLIGWFDEDNAELKSAIIELLSLSKNHQSIAFLVSLVCRDDTQAYQQTAAQGLAVLMKELQ